MASKTSASGNRLIANNKKAYFDYFIEEKYEAGMVLHGTEVKSIRAGKCSIKESYIKIENGEVYVLGMNITPYEKGNIFNKDPLRPKKLLLHKNQINKLTGELTIKGYTLVPLQVYLKEGKVKMEIGLGKGKKNLAGKGDSLLPKSWTPRIPRPGRFRYPTFLPRNIQLPEILLHQPPDGSLPVPRIPHLPYGVPSVFPAP